MIVNDKRKLGRDIKLARGVFVFLGAFGIFLSVTNLWNGECSRSAYLLGTLCIAFGPYPTGLASLVLGAWLIKFGLSETLKSRMSKHYT